MRLLHNFPPFLEISFQTIKCYTDLTDPTDFSFFPSNKCHTDLTDPTDLLLSAVTAETICEIREICVTFNNFPPFLEISFQQ